MLKDIHHKLSRVVFGLSAVFCLTTMGYVVWNYQYAERYKMRAGVYEEFAKQKLKEEERQKLEEHTKKMTELEQIYRQQEEDILKGKSRNKE